MTPESGWLPTLAMLALGLAAVAIGWRAGALTASGAAAALAVGLLVLAGGAPLAVVLVVSFASSSLLSYVGHRSKQRHQLGKGGRRDAVQVLANAGAAALLAASALWGTSWQLEILAGFTGALAASTADTWATEVGTLYGGQPRLVISGRTVPAGTSGGVTLAGILASAGGGSLIGGVAGTAYGWGGNAISVPWLAAWVTVGLLAGLAGSLADSIIGDTLQASYYCPTCRKLTEIPRHGCGTLCLIRRGKEWMTNDTVNLIATFAGAAAGAALIGRLL